jgi:hypothetical protein
MHGHRFVAALAVTAALLAPVAVQAAAPAVQRRVFDRTHKDYHVWDASEAHAYRQRLADQHRKYTRFSKQSRKQQDAYWNWRHTS